MTRRFCRIIATVIRLTFRFTTNRQERSLSAATFWTGSNKLPPLEILRNPGTVSTWLKRIEPLIENKHADGWWNWTISPQFVPPDIDRIRVTAHCHRWSCLFCCALLTRSRIFVTFVWSKTLLFQFQKLVDSIKSKKYKLQYCKVIHLILWNCNTFKVKKPLLNKAIMCFSLPNFRRFMFILPNGAYRANINVQYGHFRYF